MGKVSKVPCYCKACVNGIESGFKFVTLSVRNQHERSDITALPTRTKQFLSTGIPREEIIQFNNSVEAEPVNEQLPMENNMEEIFEDEFEAAERINAEIRLQAELDSADNIEEEEKEEEELPQAQETRNPSLFPSEPVACIFVMMIMMMHGKYLTQEGCEVMMMFFNIALTCMNMHYRFPKKLSTFISRMKFQETFYKGITKYVSCKACHSIYHLSENNDTRKRRSHCTFATHVSSVTRRTLQTCDTELYSISKSGKYNPLRVYIYNSIIATLKTFFLRDGFIKNINSWKNRQLQNTNYLFDIMDGEVWKKFKIDPNDDLPFVETSMSNLMFSLNVDWYQPYTNSVYSVGAIYMTILNLDRKLRNLRTNVVFVGLMPGPGEGHLSQLNNYMRPLVDELKTLMNVGVNMMTTTGEVLVRGAVVLGSLDLPAAAKVFGFSAHNSFFACRKCHHCFPAITDGLPKRDYSGGWDNNWPKRTKASNMEYAIIWKNATTEAERQRLVQSNGTRWSVFHELPYFDMIRFPVYDPMHNIWMGTCKRIVHHIFLPSLLNKAKLTEMAQIVSNMIMPFGIDVSSIARKITTGEGFSYLKADEWRIYSLYLSPLLLKGRIPGANYDNWMLFVGAIQIMSLPNIAISDAQRCHEKVVLFCKGFEELYGKASLYGNIHYHIHLFEQMLDFGPWHSHHAFGFERFNMDLKSAKTNHKGSIETTIAHKFLRSIHREDFFSGHLPNMGSKVDMEQLKSVYVGNDIYGLGEQQYQNTYLSHELEVSKDKDFSLIDFVEYAGSLDGSSPPHHAYGFEPLPCSTIQSLKINKLNSLLKEVEYVQLVNYYKTYFNPDDDLPYIYGKDDDTRSMMSNIEIVTVNQRVTTAWILVFFLFE